MIVGVGLDIAAVAFWRQVLTDDRTSLLDRTFTAGERAAAAAGPVPEAARLAARFAAKEAFVKALGSARTHHEPLAAALDLRQIEICNDDFGRPSLRLCGRAAQLASRLGVQRQWVSLSHEDDVAAALVVLEG